MMAWAGYLLVALAFAVALWALRRAVRYERTPGTIEEPRRSWPADGSEG